MEGGLGGVYGWLDVHRVGVAIPFAMECICSGDDEESFDEGGIHQSGSRLLLLEAFFVFSPLFYSFSLENIKDICICLFFFVLLQAIFSNLRQLSSIMLSIFVNE